MDIDMADDDDTMMMDADSEAGEKMLEVRIATNNETVTRPYLILAAEAKTRDQLVRICHDLPDRVMPVKLFGKRRSQERPDYALFLLQETRTLKHRQCHWNWTTMNWKNESEYAKWFQECVEIGPLRTLQVEVHLFYHKSLDMSQEQKNEKMREWLEPERQMHEAGRQLKEFENPMAQYIPWNENDPLDWDVIAPAHMTHDFFPNRPWDLNAAVGGCAIYRNS